VLRRRSATPPPRDLGRSLAAGVGLAGAESVGLGAGFGFEDVGVEGDAVDNRGDQARVGEDRPPVGLMRRGEHPAGFRLRERRRARHPAGFGLEDLQIVVKGEDLDVSPDRPLVSGDNLRPIENLDSAGGEADLQPAADVAGRDGVEALPH